MSIVVDRLSYTYAQGTPAQATALREISLEVHRGEWVSIVGHTGSGKSTLAQHLNLLLLPQSGSIEVDGVSVVARSKELRALRRKVGLVFQYPEQQFFAETVREEIAFAPSNWGFKGSELEDCVARAVDAVGVPASILDANPFALSGGQRRRVALASVIAMNPDYLVLDEPTAGLDASGIRELTQLMNKIRAEGMAVVQVTHDLQSALIHSDRMLVLEEGRSVSSGTPEEVARYLLENPVKGLLLPPLVRFAAGLREKGIALSLTSDLTAILDTLEVSRKCSS